MFFKKKETVKSYLKKELEKGLKQGIKEGLIDLNSMFAGYHLINLIDSARKVFTEKASLIAEKYSVTVQEVYIQIDVVTSEFRNEWLE